MAQRRTRTTCYQPRLSVYTGCAFAVVARVDASGVVAAAIRISRNRHPCAAH